METVYPSLLFMLITFDFINDKKNLIINVIFGTEFFPYTVNLYIVQSKLKDKKKLLNISNYQNNHR
jgi:hypothetical protein